MFAKGSRTCGAQCTCYFGFIVEIIEPTEEMTTLIYRVNWEHGEWMYELEEQLKLEVKAKNI